MLSVSLALRLSIQDAEEKKAIESLCLKKDRSSFVLFGRYAIFPQSINP
jgi:hypothetical protein